MKKKPKYRQCVLVKKKSEGEIRYQTSYIPEKYAVKDKVLKLLREDGVWDNGWVVVFAGDLIEEPIYWKESVRVHRDNTGDSLPKSQEK